MSAAAKAYYEAHLQALREHGAMNAARLLPFPSRLPARSVARPSARPKKHLVHEYDVAARDGYPLRIVNIRHAPGTWSGGEDVIDVYEVHAEEPSAP